MAATRQPWVYGLARRNLPHRKITAADAVRHAGGSTPYSALNRAHLFPDGRALLAANRQGDTDWRTLRYSGLTSDVH